MATIPVLDSAGLTVALEKPLAPGRAAAADSRPVVLSTEDKAALDAVSTTALQTLTGAVNEAAPASDTASSGLNGRLQRIAQRISSLIALLPAALGAGGGIKVDGSGTALPVSVSSIALPTGASTSAKQDTQSASLAAIDANTSGVNSRLQAGATTIAKAEDNASADGDVGIPAMAVRKATPANTSGTDGDYEMLQMSAGRLWISAILEAGTALIGKFGIDQTTPGTTNGVVVNSSALPSGAATAAKQPALGTAGTASTDVITVQGIASGTAQPASLADNSHVTFGAKTDAKSTATDATSITAMQIWKQISASVQAIATSIASLVTGTVLAAGSALIGRAVADASAAAGGISTTVRLASSAATTNATLGSAGACRVYSACGKNNATYDVFLVLYNSASNPPVPGTTAIRKKMVCPAGQAFVYDWPLGLSCTGGIGYAFTKLVADADTTAIAAADITAFNLDFC